MIKRYLDRDGIYDTAINDYASTSAIVYKLNKIADLEAKLAESERCAGMLHHHLTDKAIEIESLSEELAEKEEYIKMLEDDRTALNNIVEKYADKCKKYEQQLAELKETKSQELADYLHTSIPQYIQKEKISFCIEQLEKVKELCEKDITICEDYFAIVKILDNQIEELKKEMK